MEVAVTVEVEDLECDGCQCRKKALSAFFTMGSLDAEGKPNLVPELVLNTVEEMSAFEEGKQRYDAYKLKKNNKFNYVNNELSVNCNISSNNIFIAILKSVFKYL